MDSENIYRKDGSSSGRRPKPLKSRNLIRWRLTAEFPPPSQVEIKQWYTHECKLCAAKRASQLATALEMRWDKPPGTARWSVGRYSGHLQGTEIVASDATIGERVMKRHAH
jgi:hypothetical protein